MHAIHCLDLRIYSNGKAANWTIFFFTSADWVGIDDNNALIKANDLGIAMQLTNIMRDIFEDANMGRVYLPHELFGRINPYDINIQNKDVLDNIYIVKIDQIYNIAETKYSSGISGLKYLNYNHKFIDYRKSLNNYAFTNKQG